MIHGIVKRCSIKGFAVKTDYKPIFCNRLHQDLVQVAGHEDVFSSYLIMSSVNDHEKIDMLVS